MNRIYKVIWSNAKAMQKVATLSFRSWFPVMHTVPLFRDNIKRCWQLWLLVFVLAAPHWQHRRQILPAKVRAWR